MKIRIHTFGTLRPPMGCRFQDICPDPCDWCKTHDYSEACVPMLQKKVQESSKAAQEAGKVIAELKEEFKQMLKRNSEKAAQGLTITDGEKTLTLEELAQKLCEHFSGAEAVGCYDGSCPGADYCTYKHNGMVDLLREVLE